MSHMQYMVINASIFTTQFIPLPFCWGRGSYILPKCDGVSMFCMLKTEKPVCSLNHAFKDASFTVYAGHSFMSSFLWLFKGCVALDIAKSLSGNTYEIHQNPGTKKDTLWLQRKQSDGT